VVSRWRVGRAVGIGHRLEQKPTVLRAARDRKLRVIPGIVEIDGIGHKVALVARVKHGHDDAPLADEYEKVVAVGHLNGVHVRMGPGETERGGNVGGGSIRTENIDSLPIGAGDAAQMDGRTAAKNRGREIPAEGVRRVDVTVVEKAGNGRDCDDAADDEEAKRITVHGDERVGSAGMRRQRANSRSRRGWNARA